MAVSIVMARNAMAAMVARASPRSLGFTTYAAATLKLSTGQRAVMVSAAGKTGGVPPALVDAVENALGVAVIPVRSPIEGQGTWHMNDAEQHILNTLEPADDLTGALAGCVLKAVKASRQICGSCEHTLQQRGFTVAFDEAVAP